MAKTKSTNLINLLSSLQDPAVVDELVELYVNFFLNQPLNTILKSADLTTTIVAGLRGAAGDLQNETWLINLLTKNLKKVKKQKSKGSIKDGFPPEAIDALRQLVQVPISVSKETAMAIIDHAVVKTFLREILTQSILEFSQQFAAHLPGGKVMSGLMGMARDIASSRLSGVGIDIEQKAKTFVEQALSPSLKVVADFLADKNHATDLADWRGHTFGIALNLSRQEFNSAFENVNEKKMATQVAILFKSVAFWDKLAPTIKTYLDETMKQVGDRSIRSLVEGTSLEIEWRFILTRQISSILQPFFAIPEFKVWLEKHGK